MGYHLANRVSALRDVSPAYRAILFVIALHAPDSTGRWKISFKDLSLEAGYSDERSARRAVHELTLMGRLSVQRTRHNGKQGWNEFVLHLGTPSLQTDNMSVWNEGRGTESPPTDGQNDTSQTDNLSPHRRTISPTRNNTITIQSKTNNNTEEKAVCCGGLSALDEWHGRMKEIPRWKSLGAADKAFSEIKPELMQLDEEKREQTLRILYSYGISRKCKCLNLDRFYKTWDRQADDARRAGIKPGQWRKPEPLPIVEACDFYSIEKEKENRGFLESGGASKELIDDLCPNTIEAEDDRIESEAEIREKWKDFDKPKGWIEQKIQEERERAERRGLVMT